MSNDLAVRSTGEIIPQYKLGQEEIQTLVQSGIIPQGTPDGTIKMFSRFCSESNLSPFKRQVHLVKRGEKFTIQTGIDGYRAIANRTGLYAGSDDYLFDEGVGEYEMVKSGRKTPTTAKSTVYRLVGGIRCPFSATAGWKEYAQVYNGKLGTMWEKMPFLMIGKCAEALALRKAFPEELGGLYTDEEMAQATPFEEPVTATRVEVKTDQNKVVSFKEFDPKVEKITFGKFKDTEWITLDKGYLGWIVENGQPDSKAKAEMTLKYMEGGEKQQPEVDDFDTVFGPKEQTLQAPLIDELLSALDEVALKVNADELGKWQTENKSKIDELPENEKTLLRNAYKKALKQAKGGK